MSLSVTGIRSRGGSIARVWGAAAVVASIAPGLVHAEFVLQQSDRHGVEVEWTRPASFHDGSEAVSTEVEVAWIALPPGTKLQLSDIQVSTRGTLAPATNSESGAGDVVVLEPDPLEAYELGSPSWIRNQYGIPITVRGAFRGRGDSWQRVESLHFRATFAGEPGPSRRGGGRDLFERTYSSQFLNYEQGRDWRRPVAPRSLRRGSDSFSSTTSPWIRLRVVREGIHAVSGSALEDLGIDLSELDPSTLRLFAGNQLPLSETSSVNEVADWMEEISIGTEGLEDDVFDSGDRVWFLGHGADDWYSNKGMTQPGLEAFARDPYTDEGVYWLTWGGSFSGEPLRIEAVDASNVVAPFVSTVRDRVHLEETELVDFRPRDFTSSPQPDWEQYWWRSQTGGETVPIDQNVTVSLQDPVPEETVLVQARLWGGNNPDSRADPRPPDHDVELFLNDQPIERHMWEGLERQEFAGEGAWLVPGDTQVFRMTTESYADSTISRFDVTYLAFIELVYSHRLVLRDGHLAFFPGGYSGAQSFEVAQVTSDEPVVLDATDPKHPVQRLGSVTTVSGEKVLRFAANLSDPGSHRFVLAEPEDWLTPALEIDSPPQGGYLRDTTDDYQMIVVTHESLFAEAEQLAAHRRSHFPDRETANVRVVTVQNIYDEFSAGRKDATAIRNFLQFTRDRWTGGDPEDAPAYVCFFGDAHVDPRGRLEGAGLDLVPTYTRYYDRSFVRTPYSPRFSSDDYFALLDATPDYGMDMFLGRLVAQNRPQAENLVEKIIHYETQSKTGEWRNRLTLIADDFCQGTAPDRLATAHLRQTEALSDGYLPDSMERSKIYMIEYGEECLYSNKPDVAAALLRDMNEGTLIVNFTGHGGEDQVADERILEVSGVGNIDNKDNMFLFLTASCSIGKYDSTGESLAEALMRHQNGGAIVVFSAASVATSGGNARMNQQFYANMFPGGRTFLRRPVGEASANGKLSLNSTGLNQRRFVLHGDPALTLLSPELDIDFELFDVASGLALSDSLGRGQRVEVRGKVLASNGSKRTDFEGDLFLSVLDSEILRTARTVEYNLPGAEIYRGKVQVVAGDFATEFQIPSALRTGERGGAAVYVYAAGDGVGASGGRIGYYVPETAPPPSTDQAGPTLELTFPGGDASVTPGDFLTATLVDSSGINVSGLVSSRSVIFRIEDGDDVLFVENLSDDVSFGDDFRSGKLEMLIPQNLPAGRTFRAVLGASDNLNNRSTVEQSFTAVGVGDDGFVLGEIFNFPNPTEGASRFFASLTQEAEVEVEIYTIRGKRIALLEGLRVTPDEMKTSGIGWDGRDDDGDRLGNGVYYYRLTARPDGGAKDVSAVGRLVVSR